jgi:hypothetical protein
MTQTNRKVIVTMIDELDMPSNGTKEVVREICISNILVSDNSAPSGWECSIIGTIEQQRKKLNEWISERANEQHNTLLSLKSWVIA